jgi:exodeoxyribonuclease X
MALPDDRTPHRATYDALVTARLFVHLVTKAQGQPLTPEALRGGPPKRSNHGASSLFW